MKTMILGILLLLSAVAQADLSIPLLSPMHFAKIVEITHEGLYARDVKITYEIKCNEEFIAVVKTPTSPLVHSALAVGVIVNERKVFVSCKGAKTLSTALATFDVPEVIGYLVHPIQPN